METFKFRSQYNDAVIGGVLLALVSGLVLGAIGHNVIGILLLLVGTGILASCVYRNISERLSFNKEQSVYLFEQKVHKRREELYEAARIEDSKSPGIVDVDEIVAAERQLEKEFSGYDSPLLDHRGEIGLDDADLIKDGVLNEEVARRQLQNRMDKVASS